MKAALGGECVSQASVLTKEYFRHYFVEAKGFREKYLEREVERYDVNKVSVKRGSVMCDPV